MTASSLHSSKTRKHCTMQKHCNRMYVTMRPPDKMPLEWRENSTLTMMCVKALIMTLATSIINSYRILPAWNVNDVTVDACKYRNKPNKEGRYT